MNFDEIKNYWESRAAADSSAQSTTQDYYLREIEYNVLLEHLQKYSPALVADVGCGDGRTTSRLAAKLANIQFSGFDYSTSMVRNAVTQLASSSLANIKFDQVDICQGLEGCYDLIYTTRCLINLPSWELQRLAIDNIHASLKKSGVYLMIENFVEGQNNFNGIRKNFGLPEIPIREHNFFFQRASLEDHCRGRFEIIEEINISSSYYLVSRVIYSKICSQTSQQPDYLDDHHRYAAGLPFSGEFGPVRLVCLRKI
ncbi:MAG: class I SAM-dependent methyltransferase [Terrimicrobiaceae bacterium]